MLRAWERQVALAGPIKGAPPVFLISFRAKRILPLPLTAKTHRV